MKNPGRIIQLSDGLRVIEYNDQPLLEYRHRMILHLVDHNHCHILNDEGKPKIRIMSVQDWSNEMQASKLIGYVD